MKTLKESLLQFKESQATTESLFDDDLVEKDIRYRLKDNFEFAGQLVWRSRGVAVVGEFSDKPNYLGAIDWRFLKKELIKLGELDFDLGRYSYYNSDSNFERTSDSVKKTEMLARYILNVPLYDKYEKSGYNSRLRDDLVEELNRFVDKPDLYHFEAFIPGGRDFFQVSLKAKNENMGLWHYVVRLDFEIK